MVTSLMGMLAGLGMFVLVSATLTAATILLDVRFDVIDARLSPDGVSSTWLPIVIVATLLSAFVGGFVAGRAGRHGGMAVGSASSLLLILALASLVGSTLALGTISQTFDGFQLIDRLSGIDTPSVRIAALAASGGFVVLAILAGLLGGRLGEPNEETSRASTADDDLTFDQEDSEPVSLESS